MNRWTIISSQLIFKFLEYIQLELLSFYYNAELFVNSLIKKYLQIYYIQRISCTFTFYDQIRFCLFHHKMELFL